MMNMDASPLIVQTLADLKPLPQWVCHAASRGDKVPYTPTTHKPAKANDPATWGTYEQAWKAWKTNPERYTGIGFELVASQEVIVIDLDKCIKDGVINAPAQAILKRIDSYAELSPSGTGIHIWVRASSLPANLGPDKDGLSLVEMYDHDRYMTTTGEHIKDTPPTINDRSQEVESLYNEIKEERAARRQKHLTLIPKPAPPQGGGTAYGLAALENLCADLSTAANGSRNMQLNAAAFRLGQLIAGHELEQVTVAPRLRAVAFQLGLDERETERTLLSGLEAGMREPQSAPQNVERHSPPVTSGVSAYTKVFASIEEAVAAQDMKAVLSMARPMAERSTLEQARLKLSIMETFGQKFPMRQFEALVREERAELALQLQRRPNITNAASLMEKKFDEIRPIVKDILLPGLIALAGKQKLGKSWLDYHLGIAVASGGMAFGSIPVEQGDVLYLALEDNDRRVQSRLKVCLSHMGENVAAPARLDIVTEWPRMNAVGITALEDWIQSKPSPRLIIIDPWVKVKPRIPMRAGETGYDTDYEALEGLKQLADKYQLCILVQFHLRKADATDPFDELNGTTGITACADGFLSIKRPRGEKLGTLWGTGRDYEQEVNLAVSFDEALWTIVGDTETVTRGNASQEVLDVLIQETRPMFAKDLAAILGKPEGTIRKRLFDMRKRGEIEDTGHGYAPLHKIGNASNAQQYERAPQAAPDPKNGKLHSNISSNALQYSMALEADGGQNTSVTYVTLDVTQTGNADKTPINRSLASVTSPTDVTLACNAQKEAVSEPETREYIAERYMVTQNSSEIFSPTLSETCFYCDKAIASYSPNGTPVCEEHTEEEVSA